MAARYADRPEASSYDGRDYCPHVVERWVAQWYLLVSLAESPRTSSHHLRPGHADHAGPCLRSPGSPGGVAPDPQAWSDVLADLAGAVEGLPIGSLERRVVYARMMRGGTLSEVAEILHTRKATVLEAFHTGARMVAETLGFDPERGCLCEA